MWRLSSLAQQFFSITDIAYMRRVPWVKKPWKSKRKLGSASQLPLCLVPEDKWTDAEEGGQEVGCSVFSNWRDAVDQGGAVCCWLLSSMSEILLPPWYDSPSYLYSAHSRQNVFRQMEAKLKSGLFSFCCWKCCEKGRGSPNCTQPPSSWSPHCLAIPQSLSETDRSTFFILYPPCWQRLQRSPG